MKPALYVAGTSRHCGKTSVALGLFAALRDRGYAVAYMKPVGQRTVTYEGLTVDEDVALVHEVFDIPTCPSLANPVTIPPGFTYDFLVQRQCPDDLMGNIRDAYEKVSADAEIVVVEGTGHAGVGACLGVSNAQVASLLNCTAIVVSCGGIGRPIDEFELSRRCFEEQDVPVLGMISNKVYPQKMKKVEKPLRLWLQARGFVLLGLFPIESVMCELSMAQIADDMNATVLAGRDALPRRMSSSIIGAGSAKSVSDEFAHGALLITPGDREDLVTAVIRWEKTHGDGPKSGMGICLTSQPRFGDDVMRVAKASGVPIIIVEGPVCEVGSKIRSWVGSILPGEEAKISAARSLVQRHVDLDVVLDALGV